MICSVMIESEERELVEKMPLWKKSLVYAALVLGPVGGWHLHPIWYGYRAHQNLTRDMIEDASESSPNKEYGEEEGYRVVIESSSDPRFLGKDNRLKLKVTDYVWINNGIDAQAKSLDNKFLYSLKAFEFRKDKLNKKNKNPLVNNILNQ